MFYVNLNKNFVFPNVYLKFFIFPVFIFINFFSYNLNGDNMHLVKNLLLCFFIIIFLFSFNINLASEEKELNLNARSCVVLDRNSKKIIFGKNEYNKVKMASTTKIMTATIIIENCDLNKTITISKKAASTGGSRVGLKSGDKITIRDLLYGLLLCSGNDAAIALAETAAGNVQEFSNMMNNKAKELGLNNSHFESPHGLDSDNHYTTAYELALLADYALQNSTFRNIVGTKNYTITINGYPKNITNTNELLGNFNGVYGVKTGFTNGANRCLVTACKRGEMDIICVVLGCDTKNFRTQDSIKLIDYTFDNFEYFDIENFINTQFDNYKKNNINSFEINKGISNNLEIICSIDDSSFIPIRKDEKNSLKVDFWIEKNLVAPVNINSKVGAFKVYSDNRTILEGDILTTNSINKKTPSYYFISLFKNFSSILNNSFSYIL